jgi:hypothetical protein
MEHPGVRVFQLNKRVLKSKAEQELLSSFTGVFARKNAILEAIMGLKHKIILDLLKTRVSIAYPKQKEQPATTGILAN